MASALTNAPDGSPPLRQSIEVSTDRTRHSFSNQSFHADSFSEYIPDFEESTPGLEHENLIPTIQNNCEGDHDGLEAVITMDSTSKVAGMTVAPFLAKHIPEQYAPLGAPQQTTTPNKDPNTKYCYRHRPDSKCRRTADEPTMENLQRVCSTSRLFWLMLICIESGDIIPSRSTRHITCVVSFLSSTRQTSKSYAPRHTHTMLLSTIIIPFKCCQEPHQDRLPHSTPLRGVIQDSLLPRYHLVM